MKTTTAKKVNTAKKVAAKKVAVKKTTTAKKKATNKEVAAKLVATTKKKVTAKKVTTAKKKAASIKNQHPRMSIDCSVTQLTDYECRENSIKDLILKSIDKKATVESVVAKCKAKYDLDKSTVWKNLRWLRNRDYVTIV